MDCRKQHPIFISKQAGLMSTARRLLYNWFAGGGGLVQWSCPASTNASSEQLHQIRHFAYMGKNDISQGSRYHYTHPNHLSGWGREAAKNSGPSCNEIIPLWLFCGSTSLKTCHQAPGCRGLVNVYVVIITVRLKKPQVHYHQSRMFSENEACHLIIHANPLAYTQYC